MEHVYTLKYTAQVLTNILKRNLTKTYKSNNCLILKSSCEIP